MKQLSICLPCKNRTKDLKIALPKQIEEINKFINCEIFVVDYNSEDDLKEFLNVSKELLNPKNELNSIKFTGSNYFHMAHARNLSIIYSKGERIIISSSDIIISARYIEQVFSKLKRTNFIYDQRYKGVLSCYKDQLVLSGGYDERYEFYGPEDRDLHDRLVRRGLQPVEIKKGLVEVIITPDSEKVKNYRLALNKEQMSREMHKIYDENTNNKLLVANEGKDWGSWE